MYEKITFLNRLLLAFFLIILVFRSIRHSLKSGESNTAKIYEQAGSGHKLFIQMYIHMYMYTKIYLIIVLILFCLFSPFLYIQLRLYNLKSLLLFFIIFHTHRQQQFYGLRLCDNPLRVDAIFCIHNWSDI